MQTEYLRYIIEIDRTRSITQAAANLYMSQPNLSRTLLDLEEQLGFAIFRRTSKGVQPTPQGEAFLVHARHILKELDAIDGLNAGKRHADRFRVCMPRSAGFLELTLDFLEGITSQRKLDAMLRECHVRRAFNTIANGEADVGIIRFRAQYQEYFEDEAFKQRLSFKLLDKYRYFIVMNPNNPVARMKKVNLSDLDGLMEITHGDTFPVQEQRDGPKGGRIYSIDRMAQMTLLSRLPEAYMWSPELSQRDLAMWNLVQKPVEDNEVDYQNALIAVEEDMLSDIEKDYIQYVMAQLSEE